MVRQILEDIRTAVIATVLLAMIVSGIYPVLVWGIAQGFFPSEANGSLIKKDGTTIGSRLITQEFTGEAYFHPRPSAAGTGYDPMNSGGSNLGPLSGKLIDTVKGRIMKYRTENALPEGTPIPTDAVTASASGLDPHISPANARLQAARVAQARGLSEEVVQRKIAARLEGRDLGILGEPRVNVLLMNLDLDRGK